MATVSNKATNAAAAIPRPSRAEIASRAYQIFLERGCQPGHEMDDWLQAEYELIQLPISKLVEMEPPKAAKGPRRKKSIIEIVRAALY